MRKIKNILTCFLLTICTCQIAMASGTTWSVRYIKSGPSSENKYSDTVVYAVSTAVNRINESCLHASNPADENGYIGCVA